MESCTRRALALVLIVASVLIAGISSAVAALPVIADTTWGTNGKVDAVLRVGNTIYVAGTFSSLQDPNSTATKPVTNLAGIDATTGLPTSFAPAVNGEVFGLAQSPDGSRLYAVGNFTTVGAATQKRIAVFDTTTGALTAWKPFGWPNNVVRGIPVTADHVYIGGSFTLLGTTAASHIASLSPVDGSASPGFAASADDLVRDFAVTSGRLYLAGNFTNVNGTPQGRLTAINPTTGATIAGVYHPSYPVLDLAVGPNLYGAGGGGGGKAFARQPDHRREGLGEEDRRQRPGRRRAQRRAVLRRALLQVHGTRSTNWCAPNRPRAPWTRPGCPNVTAGFLGVFAVDGYSANKLYVGGDFTRVQDQATNFAQFTDGSAPTVADVSLTLSASPASPTLGQNVTYTATITNSGPDTALNTVVTDVLPASLDL